MTIINSQIVFLGFSLRNFHCNFVGNKGIYIMGEVEAESQTK